MAKKGYTWKINRHPNSIEFIKPIGNYTDKGNTKLIESIASRANKGKNEHDINV